MLLRAFQTVIRFSHRTIFYFLASDDENIKPLLALLLHEMY